MGFLGGQGAKGAAGPSAGSLRSANIGQVYGPKSSGGSGMSTHHWLWVLVALEVAVLVVLRGVVLLAGHRIVSIQTMQSILTRQYSIRPPWGGRR